MLFCSFLDELEAGQQFLIFAYIVRSVEAVGSAASITACMTIVANIFPNNVALVQVSVEQGRGAMQS